MNVEKASIYQNILMKNMYVRIAVVHIRKNTHVNNKLVHGSCHRVSRGGQIIRLPPTDSLPNRHRLPTDKIRFCSR
jgi:6,7-dimethyl-8-ribityllumazine synthase